MDSSVTIKLSNLIMDDICKNKEDIYQVAFFNIHNFEIEKKICLNLDKNNCNKFRINNLQWLETVDKMELPDVLIMRKGEKLSFELEKLILDLNIKVRYVDESILENPLEFDKKIKDIKRVVYHARAMKYFNKEKELVESIEEKHKNDVTRTQITDEFVLEFLKLIKEKDDVTFQHVKNVSKYVDVFVNGMIPSKKLTVDEVTFLKKMALIHDIGKLTIPNQILKKEGKLDTIEREVVKTHIMDTAYLFNNKLLDSIKDIVLSNLERYDGMGYPNRLKGKSIPYYARIISVLDTFDSLTTNNQNKNVYEVLQVLKNESGKKFDPEVVECFIRGVINSQDLVNEMVVGGVSK